MLAGVTMRVFGRTDRILLILMPGDFPDLSNASRSHYKNIWENRMDLADFNARRLFRLK
jgi:hypothetical protein